MDFDGFGMDVFQFSMPTPESASAAAYGTAPGGGMPYQAQPGFGVGHFILGFACVYVLHNTRAYFESVFNFIILTRPCSLSVLFEVKKQVRCTTTSGRGRSLLDCWVVMEEITLSVLIVTPSSLTLTIV